MCVYSTLAEQGEGSFGSFQSTLIDTVAYYAAFQAHEWLTPAFPINHYGKAIDNQLVSGIITQFECFRAKNFMWVRIICTSMCLNVMETMSKKL